MSERPDRPEATNTGGWIDAEEAPVHTCGMAAAILEIMLALHGDIDAGQRLMVASAISLLRDVTDEMEIEDEVDDE